MNGLYTATEISRMTNDALDELLSHYQDTGNVTGEMRVQDELGARVDDELAELEHEREQDRQQMLHDEMVNDMLAEDGRWG